MISLDLSTLPNFVRPELLLHPLIPPALYGVNPRTIKGKDAWDITRREAYKANNYCCWACGVYQLDTPSGRLDAHEAYRYIYGSHKAFLAEVVGLCRRCHQFIHWGRLAATNRGAVIRVLSRGLTLLHEAGLPLARNQYHYLITHEWHHKLPAFMEGDKPKLSVGLPKEDFMATGWKLMLDGKEYDGNSNYTS